MLLAEEAARAEGSPKAETGLEWDRPGRYWNLPVRDLRRNAAQHGFGRSSEICLMKPHLACYLLSQPSQSQTAAEIIIKKESNKTAFCLNVKIMAVFFSEVIS